MRTLKLATFVLAVLAMAPAAWAQAAVTTSDVMRLEGTADEIGRQSGVVRKTDPTTAASLEKSLGDLRDDIAVLRVKLRRNGSVTPAEFSDVQTRLSILRAKAMNALPGTSAPMASAPAASSSTSTPSAQMGSRGSQAASSNPAPAPMNMPAPPPSRTVAPPPASRASAPMPASGTPSDRVFLNVSFGATLSTADVKTEFPFSLYEEPGLVTVDRSVTSKALFDITGGYRINESLGVGVSFFTRSSTSDGSITASVPDPVAFDSPRSVTATLPDMAHSEKWFAVLLAYFVPVGEKMDLMILAGPAVAKLTHDLATSATISEGATGPQVAVGVTTIARSYVGFQIGADVQYFLMQGSGAVKSVGVGGFFRYSRAKANLTDDVKLTLGGAQVGGGLRLRF